MTHRCFAVVAIAACGGHEPVVRPGSGSGAAGSGSATSGSAVGPSGLGYVEQPGAKTTVTFERPDFPSLPAEPQCPRPPVRRDTEIELCTSGNNVRLDLRNDLGHCFRVTQVIAAIDGKAVVERKDEDNGIDEVVEELQLAPGRHAGQLVVVVRGVADADRMWLSKYKWRMSTTFDFELVEHTVCAVFAYVAGEVANRPIETRPTLVVRPD